MKKVIGWLIALVIVAFAGFKAYTYWDSTYNGTTAYAIVQDATKHKSKTSKGEDYKVDGQQQYYYSYDFKWITEDGKELNVGWDSRESSNPTQLAAGTIVKAEVSSKRVIKGPNSVNKAQVPSEVMGKLQ